MANSPDTLLFTGEVHQQVGAGAILVTPTSGSQGALADLLATATGGAVAATTLSASAAVTLNPANANVSIAPTGTGTHAINNMTVGGTTPAAGSFTTLAASGLVALTGAPSIGSAVPASAAAAGVAGTITWGTGFVYVCVATNTWQRVAIATW